MFTKKDLRNGMVVETRDGSRYVVAGYRLIGIGNDGWLSLGDYDNQLYDLDQRLSSNDIMMVFDIISSLELDKIDRPPLFDRKSAKASSKNNDKTKYMCKELAKIYNLDESKLYSHLLRIIYSISDSTISITEFDIEKCSEIVINKAICELGKDCSTYFIMKNTEKD